MENENSPFDFIDLLCALGLFATFAIFALCMWLLKREMNKKKAANQKDANK